jgi:hypothetical protein
MCKKPTIIVGNLHFQTKLMNLSHLLSHQISMIANSKKKNSGKKM